MSLAKTTTFLFPCFIEIETWNNPCIIFLNSSLILNHLLLRSGYYLGFLRSFGHQQHQFISRHRRCYVTKDVLGNFAKIRRKHLCQSLLKKDLLKRDCGTGAFLGVFQNFHQYLFNRIPPGDCSC